MSIFKERVVSFIQPLGQFCQLLAAFPSPNNHEYSLLLIFFLVWACTVLSRLRQEAASLSWTFCLHEQVKFLETLKNGRTLVLAVKFMYESFADINQI